MPFGARKRRKEGDAEPGPQIRGEEGKYCASRKTNSNILSSVVKKRGEGKGGMSTQTWKRGRKKPWTFLH